MHLEDAYTFCYELDPRARIIEIYTEEQMDFLTIILSRQFLQCNRLRESICFRPWNSGKLLVGRFWYGSWGWVEVDKFWSNNCWLCLADRWAKAFFTKLNKIYNNLGEPNEGIGYNCMYWAIGRDKAYDFPCDKTTSNLRPLCQIPL